MLNPYIPKLRRRRGPVKATSAPPAPPSGPPVLVSANFDVNDGPKVTLAFDRAVQIDAYDPIQIWVEDQPAEQAYDGSGGSVLLNETTVVIHLAYGGTSSGADVVLDASELLGIVAVDGGEAWAGVWGLVLPFG